MLCITLLICKGCAKIEDQIKKCNWLLVQRTIVKLTSWLTY